MVFLWLVWSWGLWLWSYSVWEQNCHPKMSLWYVDYFKLKTRPKKLKKNLSPQMPKRMRMEDLFQEGSYFCRLSIVQTRCVDKRELAKSVKLLSVPLSLHGPANTSLFKPNICFSFPCQLPLSPLRFPTTTPIASVFSWRWHLRWGFQLFWWGIQISCTFPFTHVVKFLLNFPLLTYLMSI